MVAWCKLGRIRHVARVLASSAARPKRPTEADLGFTPLRRAYLEQKEANGRATDPSSRRAGGAGQGRWRVWAAFSRVALAFWPWWRAAPLGRSEQGLHTRGQIRLLADPHDRIDRALLNACGCPTPRRCRAPFEPPAACPSTHPCPPGPQAATLQTASGPATDTPQSTAPTDSLARRVLCRSCRRVCGRCAPRGWRPTRRWPRTDSTPGFFLLKISSPKAARRQPPTRRLRMAISFSRRALSWMKPCASD